MDWAFGCLLKSKLSVIKMSKVKRKLTTILATDCVGFSKRMDENEELTLENLKACRSIIDPQIKEFGGRIFYTAGDSVIAEFESPVECVNAAIGFQKAIMIEIIRFLKNLSLTGELAYISMML